MRNKITRRAVLAALTAVLALGLFACGGNSPGADLFRTKAELLKEEALADWVRDSLSEAPAGQAGYAVFFSVCDGTARASVYSGVGSDLDAAWGAAADSAVKALNRSKLSPRWVKADLVYHSETLSARELGEALTQSQPGFFRYGLALDSGFQTALLEGELNSTAVYDYEKGEVSLDYLNRYLAQAGRKAVEALPEEYQLFGCAGWLCDEENAVWKLDVSGSGSGGRSPGLINGEQARELVTESAVYLAGQIKEDGSFVYGRLPCFEQELDGYNILRHAGSVWALIQGWQIAPEQISEKKIQMAVEYMLNQLGYDPEGRAFLQETDSGEIKLGGNALALIVLGEYTEAFQDTRYLEDCRALGGGIISMLNPETEKFVHVLNNDLTLKDEFRTVYYDGEAAFALARLYGLTGEDIWLQAAQMAVDRMIAEDYVQYRDHWVSYAMNEILKYVPTRTDYYAFALENAQKNLKDIYEQERTQPVYLELLMSAFETYDRLAQAGGSAEGFDPRLLLGTIYVRADRQLDGFFYPEYAMYMQNPQSVLHSFMIRQDKFRVRIDDVQHNIGGYYLYAKNYDRLLANGLLEQNSERSGSL